ncbi:transcription elongation factor GreAB [Mucilaginibacter hurinus]|uniref:Transcription elongation factor GreAB n=1 Tax=Mucilaginibacter hurinus TaxID=2201324 RepID=A0A367GLY4_9SPHI|nr:GreA/GreB family elongation factor [Mucilaginibacter hurinus]RCH53701.1 transcription elongation factor GreAB [Mucilaginibacter hurinus]
MNSDVKISDTPIILTTGMYDLLKEELRKRRLSKYNEEKLTQELKNANQVLSKDIPETIVTVNKSVTVKDVETAEEFNYKLVAPGKARRKNNNHSILSPIGVAVIGYAQGALVVWEMPEGVKAFKITEVKYLK